jgi:hypothetical protein
LKRVSVVACHLVSGIEWSATVKASRTTAAASSAGGLVFRLLPEE